MDQQLEICNCEVIHGEVVSKVKSQLPEKDTLRQLADLYKVFSDFTRVQILWALELNELCVCDLASLLNMTVSAISHQLKALRVANLVKTRRDGKIIYYSLSDDHVKSILLTGFEHVNE
ncbi:MAG: transcriptional regulator [Clostridiales bacterium 43-6]|nr:MAG: transcriptional regulator [Clostridiales bacterium 43-6]